MSELWSERGLDERSYYRQHAIAGRVTLNIGDDSGNVPLHQVTGYAGELRNNVQRIGHFGLAYMPLPGAKGVALWQSGYRGADAGAIIGTIDTRYPPTGLQPGEHGVYMVDGAGGDGTGGTLRWLVRGALGWLSTLYGKVIAVGDSNTQSCTISGGAGMTISVTGSTVTITGANGDVVIKGVSLVDHVHSGVTPGSGDSGPPVS